MSEWNNDLDAAPKNMWEPIPLMLRLEDDTEVMGSWAWYDETYDGSLANWLEHGSYDNHLAPVAWRHLTDEERAGV